MQKESAVPGQTRAQPVTGFYHVPWPQRDAQWQEAYALLDAQTLAHDELRELLADVHKEPCIPGGVGASIKTPFIIDLRTCTAVQIEMIYQQFYWRDGLEARLEPSVMGARLVSAHPIEKVAEQIANILVFNRQGGVSGGRSLMRLWDPNIFANMGWLYQAEQLSALLGGVIDAWEINWLGYYYRLDAQKLPALPNTMLAHLPDAQQVAFFPFFKRLTQYIKDKLILQESHDPERFVYTPYTPALSPDGTVRRPCPDRFVFSRGTAYILYFGSTFLSLQSEDEEERYTDLVLRYGAAFTDHPTLASHWKALTAGKMLVPELFALLTDADKAVLDALPPFYLTMTPDTVIPFPRGLFL